MWTPDRELLAWAAGLFDGEGWIGFGGKACRCIPACAGRSRISINQVDRQVLDRFQQAVGVGTVNGPHAKQGNSRPIHRYQTSGAVNVQLVIAQMWPWLGEVKREQALPVLRGMHWERPQAGRTKCNRGHPYEGNRTAYGQCRACMRASDRKRYLKAVS